MAKDIYANDISKREKERFYGELKLCINRRLFEKHIIPEDMYIAARELLLKHNK